MVLQDAVETAEQSPAHPPSEWPMLEATAVPFVPRLDALTTALANAAIRGAQTQRDLSSTNAEDCERLALLLDVLTPSPSWVEQPLLTSRSMYASDYMPSPQYYHQSPPNSPLHPHYPQTIQSSQQQHQQHNNHHHHHNHNHNHYRGSGFQQQHNNQYHHHHRHHHHLQFPQLPLSVFIGNIPPNTTPNALLRLVTQRGPVTEILCDFSPDAWLTAFVTFARPADAHRAVESLNNRRALRTSRPHRLVCCFAPASPASLGCLPPVDDVGERHIEQGPLPFFPKFAPGEPGTPPCTAQPRFSLLKDGPPGANLFLYGIPSDWTEVTLLRLCQEFGYVVGLRVPRAACNGGELMQRLNKGFGFVSYDSTASSAKALAALNGKRFFSKPLNVQLKTGESLHPELQFMATPRKTNGSNVQQAPQQQSESTTSLCSTAAPLYLDQ